MPPTHETRTVPSAASGFSPAQLRRILATLIIGAGIVAYGNSLQGEFVLDDIPCIRDNQALGTFFPADSEVPSGLHHRPVGRWTFTLNYLLAGKLADGTPRVAGFHITNLAIHIAAALLLFGLVRRTLGLPRCAGWSETDALWFAAAVALIWLVHPLTTAAVTYTVQRLESLMALCFLALLYCLVRGATSGRSWPWYLAAIACMWLGAGNKEVMAMALPVGLLYDRVFLAASGREIWRRRGWVYAGFLTAIAWLAYWLTQLPADFGAGVGKTEVTSWQHLRTQPEVILYYLGLAFWPARLCFTHGWQIAIDPVKVYSLGAVVLLLVGLSLWALWRWPPVGFLGVSFFLILAPTSSFLPLNDTAFEYRMYLPLVAPVVLVLAGLWQLTAWTVRNNEARRLVRLVLVVLVASALCLRTTVRNRDYITGAKLWQSVVDVYPEFPRALNNLGIEYEKAGKFEAARNLFERALALYPDFPEAQLELAQALARDREFARSLRYYEEYLRQKPDNAAAHAGLAQTASLAGNESLATEHFEKAIALAPLRKETWRSYGNWRARQKRYQEAAKLYRRALEIDPEFERAHLALGITLLEIGDDAGALAELEMARQQAPSVAALAKLAWLKATSPHDDLRNGAEAVALGKQAVEKSEGHDPAALDALAAAYAENGNFPEAISHEERALRLVAREGELAGEFTDRLIMYRQEIPYRRVAPAP